MLELLTANNRTIAIYSSGGCVVVTAHFYGVAFEVLLVCLVPVAIDLSAEIVNAFITS